MAGGLASKGSTPLALDGRVEGASEGSGVGGKGGLVGTEGFCASDKDGGAFLLLGNDVLPGSGNDRSGLEECGDGQRGPDGGDLGSASGDSPAVENCDPGTDISAGSVSLGGPRCVRRHHRFGEGAHDEDGAPAEAGETRASEAEEGADVSGGEEKGFYGADQPLDVWGEDSHKRGESDPHGLGFAAPGFAEPGVGLGAQSSG